MVLILFAALVAAVAAPGQSSPPLEPAAWTVYVANDNCPDYTWGLTEKQTRQAFADVVRGHLDEMTRTDDQPPDNRDRYNAAVTQEVLCFLERYPERKDELVRRVKEGRLYVSPYLCNSLWAFQGFEGAVRTFYPARRLEREWGIRIDTAHHIELPSLPWGTATILAGCGINRLSMPYLGYDSTFDRLKTPPLFIHEGPDGSRVRVALDRFACGKSNYTQGANVLSRPEAIDQQWLAHYAQLGEAYPLRAILASGTHGDISLGSGGQARGFADAIIRFNARPAPHARLVNATFPQFWAAVDAQESKRPRLPTVRGDLGHAWDLWPVCLAKYAAGMREGDRRILAAEALAAMASQGDPKLHEATRAARQQAEWFWAMLSDHAWNGTNPENQRHNADLRRRWSDGLQELAAQVTRDAWAGLAEPSDSHVTVFNSLSFPRRGPVHVELPVPAEAVGDLAGEYPCQTVVEDGRKLACFVSPEVSGYGLKQFDVKGKAKTREARAVLRASSSRLESPFYRATIDAKTGGLASLVHRATGAELVGRKGAALGRTVYFNGQGHTLADVRSEVADIGPVLARVRTTGGAAGLKVTTDVTLYAELDRVDFDVRITKPVTTVQDRLCQVFPLAGDGTTLRIATTGAVIRPRTEPEGDLVPGADTRRFAVQEFLDVSSEKFGVTLAPLDAFVLRMDLGEEMGTGTSPPPDFAASRTSRSEPVPISSRPLTIEAIGNDQNYKEVIKDQNGETSFRFRYSLRAKTGGYDEAASYAFARGAASPLTAHRGRMAQSQRPLPAIQIDPARAIATCLKPADGDASGGLILRLHEVGGRAGPLRIGLAGFRKAVETDLLERDVRELPAYSSRSARGLPDDLPLNNSVSVDLRPHGFAAIRLLR